MLLHIDQFVSCYLWVDDILYIWVIGQLQILNTDTNLNNKYKHYLIKFINKYKINQIIRLTFLY